MPNPNPYPSTSRNIKLTGVTMLTGATRLRDTTRLTGATRLTSDAIVICNACFPDKWETHNEFLSSYIDNISV